MRRAVTLLLLALAFGCETSSNVKAPSKDYFVKYFGRDGNQRAVGLIVNDDGTFYILGNSRPSSVLMQQVYLAKANALGDKIWQVTYGDSTKVEMEARDFKIANGSIVVAANRKPSPTSAQNDIQLIQFKPENGDTVQSKILQIEPALSPTPKNVWVNGLTVLSDGGFLVTGYTDYVVSASHTFDALQLRTDANLNLKLSSTPWKPTQGAGDATAGHNYSVAAFQTSSDSIYVFGYTDGPKPPSTDEDFWAFGLNAVGDPQLGVSVYFVNNSNDELTHALKATQGGYLLSGLAIDNSQGFGLKIFKIRYDNLSFDQSKDVQFTFPGKSLGKGGSTKYATTCNSTSGYFALTNTYNNATGNSDILLLKLDLTLQETWSNPVILGGDGDDTAAAVAELPDGHIMVLGTLNLGNPPEQFKIALMKLNSAGKLSD